MKRTIELGMERLEQRDNPATAGIGWGYSKHLSISFVPDGTDVNGNPSVLFRTLNTVAPTATWQTEILRSFNTWAQAADLNLELVADSGDPLGSPGAVQGDPRFGDIRISAVPLPMDTIATNTPYLTSGSTWAGDVVINSNYLFGLGGLNATTDLYTAILNEAGNVFGVLDTATDPTSGTFHQYIGPKTGINADNVADMQSLYGVRQKDEFEGDKGNNTFNTAEGFDFKDQSVLLADIASSNDVDFYKFNVPSGTTALNVRLNTRENSLLVGNISVFNSSFQLLATANQVDSFGTNPALSIRLPASGTYFVRVAAANGTRLNFGEYELIVDFDSEKGNSFTDRFALTTSNALIENYVRNLTASGMKLDTDNLIKSVIQVDEVNSNETLSKADTLRTYNLGTSTAPRAVGLVQGAINSATDIDWYKVKAPSAKTVPLRFGVVVWALDAVNGLAPKVEVFDKNGRAIPVRILANGGGTFSIELANATPDADYFIKVSPLVAGRSNSTGQYNLQATFDNAPATQFNTFATDVLTATTPQKTSNVVLSQNQLLQFALGGTTTTGVAALRMDIFDASGNQVFTLIGASNQPAVTGTVYLPTGTYTVVYTAVAAPGTTLGNVFFSLEGRKLSDPIGPQIIGSQTTTDTTWTAPVPPPSDQSNTFVSLISSWINTIYW